MIVEKIKEWTEFNNANSVIGKTWVFHNAFKEWTSLIYQDDVAVNVVVVDFSAQPVFSSSTQFINKSEFNIELFIGFSSYVEETYLERYEKYIKPLFYYLSGIDENTLQGLVCSIEDLQITSFNIVELKLNHNDSNLDGFRVKIRAVKNAD